MAETSAKTAFIKTYGCQMNVYDSARMADLLAEGGYRMAESPDAADLVILNTCHIREKAAEKVYSELGRLRPMKAAAEAQGRRMMLAVGGCVAQAEGEEMLRRAPYLDLVFGPQTYHRLGSMLDQADSGARVVATEFPAETKFDALPLPRPGKGDAETGAAVGAGQPGAAASAGFLSVQEGCDKFCTFCVVPYTRGAEYSRPVDAILDEARALVARGMVEITLLGQNVNAFHGIGPDGREWGLGRLLRRLAEIDGLKRLRYTTSHPRDMDEDLIRAHGEVPMLMPYLHLPVQSGSDRVLKAMNRGYTAASYRALIDRLREQRPDLALSSDFIVGFPGETAEDFSETLELVKRVGFAQAYSFMYSARPGTPAAEAERTSEVDQAEKAARLKALQDLLAEQSRAFNRACVGRVMEVLFDRPGRRPGQIAGRSPYLQAVHVDAGARFESLLGGIHSVRILTGLPNSLSGVLEPASMAQPGSSAP